MPNVSERFNDSTIRHYKRREWHGCPNYTDWVLSTAGTITEGENWIMASRVRPSPLFLYPTPLPVHWTKKNVMGFEQYTRPYLQCTRTDRLPIASVKFGSAMTIPVLNTNWQGVLRNRVKGLRINLGAHVVEYKSTADMFVQAARFLQSKYRRIRKLGYSHEFTMSDVSSVILATNLGVKPIISDLLQLHGMLVDVLDRPIWVRMSTTQEKTADKTHLHCDTFTKQSDRAIFYFRLEAPKTAPLVAGNILEHAWEIFPMSYFIDYLIPIGSYLSSLDAMSGVKQVVGTVTTKTKWHLRQTSAVSGSNYVVEEPFLCSYRSHYRSVYTSVPQVELPTYEPSYSHSRLVNALAALHLIRKDRLNFTKYKGL